MENQQLHQGRSLKSTCPKCKPHVQGEILARSREPLGKERISVEAFLKLVYDDGPTADPGTR